ncbi:hypothetical protein [Micromonospora sp. NPDC049891]|uniref:hypothetical protein n=1 Tax=Micromonospora sp. NPDC049891 TaxID=3155655 RepID=UPI0033F6795E
MTPDEARRELNAIANERRRLDKRIQLLDQRERAAIEAAWRARVTPTEIAIRVGRSTAHVRKFRPDDVPPARSGGMAKVKRQNEQS